jgi:hypothetical protein
MSAQDSVDVRPVAQIERPSQGSLISIDENAPAAKSVTNPRQIYALMAYYMALLIGCIALIALLIWNNDGSILKPPTDLTNDPLMKERLLASMAFLVTGAIVGSVLYQIRMLFRSYIKLANFDSRWVPKYVSAPVEAAGLALAIASLIQGGAVVLGGQGFEFGHGKPFAAFGIGALIGFGIREVVGWLGNVSRTVFPTETPALQSTEANQRKRDATKRELDR